uniref:Helicase C-terminal domain-containing protein n=1 Tax=Lotharella globosa TaxID=91324 RepID=A0A7S4E1L8_9EUKA|mmetsp:Transcript_5842/g.10589  ORF Transcript_5842/g.10589 Transcript_5842/m.10589 type:complete len:111 (+) Transcript_5842:1-333(+)
MGGVGGVGVLLLQLKSGGQGLNLTEATHVMFVDPSLNPAQHLQAAGRVHRIGQTRRSFVHWFLIKNSIEEVIYQLHCRRRNDTRIGAASAKERDALSVDDVGALLNSNLT